MQTVGQIITKSLAILRDHPLLALPVIFADLLGFAAIHIQHALHQPLFAWVFSEKVSVLATEKTSFVLTPENATKAALLTVPLIWACYFLSVFLYTTALVVMSVLLDQLEMDQKPDFGSAVVLAWKDKRRLFLFSISLTGALAVIAILGAVLISGSMQIPWLAEEMGRDFGYFVAFPLQLVVVLLFVGPALRRLRKARISPPPSLWRPAALLGVFVVTAQIAYLLLLEHVVPSDVFKQTTVVGYLTREAIVSLIGASPYIVFFIGLSLLAASDRRSATDDNPEPADGGEYVTEG